MRLCVTATSSRSAPFHAGRARTAPSRFGNGHWKLPLEASTGSWVPRGRSWAEARAGIGAAGGKQLGYCLSAHVSRHAIVQRSDHVVAVHLKRPTAPPSPPHSCAACGGTRACAYLWRAGARHSEDDVGADIWRVGGMERLDRDARGQHYAIDASDEELVPASTADDILHTAQRQSDSGPTAPNALSTAACPSRRAHAAIRST